MIGETPPAATSAIVSSSRASPSGTRPEYMVIRPWHISPTATWSGSRCRRPDSTTLTASLNASSGCPLKTCWNIWCIWRKPRSATSSGSSSSNSCGAGLPASARGLVVRVDQHKRQPEGIPRRRQERHRPRCAGRTSAATRARMYPCHRPGRPPSPARADLRARAWPDREPTACRERPATRAGRRPRAPGSARRRCPPQPPLRRLRPADRGQAALTAGVRELMRSTRCFATNSVSRSVPAISMDAAAYWKPSPQK